MAQRTAGDDAQGDRVLPGIPDRAFFGIFDGAMPSFTVATSAVNADGSFSLRVPDLARDPVVTSFDERHLRGVLSLAVRESATGNFPYRLELMDAISSESRPASALAGTSEPVALIFAIRRPGWQDSR